jgi:hypothetical protein
MNSQKLVVSTRREPKLNDGAFDGELSRKQVAVIDRLTIRSHCVDLVCCVAAVDESRCRPTGPASPDDDHVSGPDRALALNAEQFRSQVENQVVPLVSQRASYTDSVRQRHCGYRSFRNSTFLIRRQHRRRIV